MRKLQDKSFNRTTVELKLENYITMKHFIHGFNRTTVELK